MDKKEDKFMDKKEDKFLEDIFFCSPNRSPNRRIYYEN